VEFLDILKELVRAFKLVRSFGGAADWE